LNGYIAASWAPELRFEKAGLKNDGAWKEFGAWVW
jgi:hypothetical protein